MTSEVADKISALICIFGALMCLLVIGGILIHRKLEKEQTMATPTTDEGLEHFDDLPPGLAVALAWSEPGENPQWHRKMQAEVRKQMPVLARALDRLIEN